MNDNPLPPLTDEMADQTVGTLAFADLVQEDQDSIGEIDRWARGAMSSLVSFAKTSDVDFKWQFYVDNISPLLFQLDDATEIPNTSGLAGASNLTVGEFKMLVTWLVQIKEKIDTNMRVVVKAVGINSE